MPEDTIVAPATARGRGGIAIIRISGPQAEPIAQELTQKHLQPRMATLVPIVHQGVEIDRGIAVLYRGSRSYTGETVVELQGHGNPVLVGHIVEACCALGARPARPGEFTERAFLNGRVDLAQAEAVATLIESRTRAAAQAASRTIGGALSALLHAIDTDLRHLRVQVEALLNFADEEVDQMYDPALAKAAARLHRTTASLLTRAQTGQLLTQGARIVITGPPNAGKSSLINRLTQQDLAIVSSTPGTTRDSISAPLVIGEIPVELIDTAGLPPTTDDPLELAGMTRTLQALELADLILVVLDASVALTITPDIRTLLGEDASRTLETCPYIYVYNKIDILDADAPPIPGVAISALMNQGLDKLAQAVIETLSTPGSSSDEALATSTRQLAGIQQAEGYLALAHQRLMQGLLDLAAQDFRDAQTALAELLTPPDTEALLGDIFSSFCIGK